MPSIAVRTIRRLNEERLVWGILPTPWLLAFSPVMLTSVFVKTPRNITEVIIFLSILAAILALYVAVHRVSRAKIIPHWFKWNLSQRGAVLGRDVSPIPHMFHEMDEPTQAWLLQQAQLDRKQGAQWVRDQQRQRKQDTKKFRQAQNDFEKNVRKDAMERQRAEQRDQRLNAKARENRSRQKKQGVH